MSFISFNQKEDGVSTLARPALVFIEGEHTDSQKRTHFFGPDRIKKIVENSNNFLRQGRRIPFQLDHKKDQGNNIGDVESEFYTKVITEQDLPNSKFQHLVGKLGVFVDSIVARGEDVVQKIKSKSISTLSPGIDPATESFCEISATPVPAIIGPTLFSRAGSTEDNIILFESSLTPANQDNKQSHSESSRKFERKAFSFEELKKLSEDKTELKQSYDKLSEGLFRILYDIRTSSEEELKGINPIKASYDAIEHFIDQVSEMFNLQESEEDSDENDTETDLRVTNNTKGSGGKPYPPSLSATDYHRKLKSVGFIRNY
jgi:hypothetical protein